MAQPFLLDCDTGVDDSLAIAYLVSDPNADVVGITNTYGNVAVEQTTSNTLSLLTLLGRTDIPVAAGASKPLTTEFDGGAPYVHGANGVGDIELPVPAMQATNEYAPDMIIRLAREHAGALNLIAIAPLTNIALALRKEPELPRLINHLTIMGGAAMVPGNISAVAEANIGNDADAAAEVFAARWPITVVPLDVTMSHLLEETDRQALLDSPRPIPQTLGRMLKFYFDFYQGVYGRSCCALHDPMAIAIATGSIAVGSAPVVLAEVDATHGPGRGQLIADMRGMYQGYPEPQAEDGPRCRLVLSLESDFAPQLMTRLLGL
jgi:purine nucleosidase